MAQQPTTSLTVLKSEDFSTLPVREQVAQLVFLAMGGASVCWDDQGVFDAERARDIGEDAVDEIMFVMGAED